MKSTATLLIGYYHDLLLRDINADLLTDKMNSAGLLTDTEVSIISSGHSIHHKNWLLLEHVRHMDVEALVTFCELLQKIWPEIGLQLITGIVSYVHIASYIKTHGSESQGQEKAGHAQQTSELFTGSTGLKLVNALNKPQ